VTISHEENRESGWVSVVLDESEGPAKGHGVVSMMRRTKKRQSVFVLVGFSFDASLEPQSRAQKRSRLAEAALADLLVIGDW
jgi:hypothetical protein